MTSDKPVFHLRYVLELMGAALAGWLLATRLVNRWIDRLLSPYYGGYDWYQSFMSVIDLLGIFIIIGFAIIITVEFRHPKT